MYGQLNEQRYTIVAIIAFLLRSRGGGGVHVDVYIIANIV